ncbi:MAG: phenylalanine--tRNA ligase subunit beta [Limisphaerales bacterium]
MKVTLNWLKQYVDFNWSPEELTDRLTLLGLEVEGVQKLGGEFEGVVVAQVLTRDKHPNADKLSVCRVNDGQGERQIVCGAQNFQAGDKVPLVLPGATLPTPAGEAPFTIKVGKIRGIESHGMMCSPKELGLAEDASGLLILPADATVGQPFAEHLGRAGTDVVYDLEVTPNRPDLNSLIGIAREISAVTGNPLRLPEIEVSEADEKVADLVVVRLDDAELCPRYTARVVRGVRVGPSPAWLRAALEKVGLRSINNVVDVTNYVMLESGQPLHAFDYRLIARAANGGPTIVVRRAAEGERFKTLDGQEHVLAADMLLIADEQKGIALAGVMGGENSEIHDTTVEVLIESAYFNPTNIRRTSKRLGLRTDASYRFERGADLGMSDWASQRCARLILETAGGQLAAGVVDAFPNPPEARQISLRHEQVNALLGLTLQPAEIEYYLGQLGLKLAARKARPVDAPAGPEPAVFRIPTWRVDLKREVDLIEEVCRLHGVDQIPSTPPRGAIGANEYDAVHDQLAELRRILSGLGLNEAQGQTLVAEAGALLAAPAEALVPLENPLSSDMSVLRPSLLPGLLDSLRHNASRRNDDLALFEVGRVFVRSGGRTVEQRRVAVALTGKRAPGFWAGEARDAVVDLHDLKGVVEEFLELAGLRGVNYARRTDSTTLLAESAAITLGGKLALGELGQLLPTLARRYDLRGPVFLAELDLDQLLARRNAGKSFKPLPQFPSIRRDVAMLVSEATTHDGVLGVVRQAKPANFEAVELFDVFRGQNVPAGQKSLAYAFTYRAPDRTLTDTEVNTAHEKLVEQFKRQLQATVRDS